MKHVVIVGAGLAGLATAYTLEKRAKESGRSIRCTVVEQLPRLGGKVHTEEVDGHRIEAGPDSYIAQKPWATDLIRELGLADQLIASRDHLQRVCVVNRGALVPFPKGFRLAIPTEWKPFLTTPLVSWPGKLQMARDWFTPPRTDPADESLASFIRRRLGDEALQKMAGPMMAGIFSGDPEQMSIQATFPQFVEMERKHGSLIRAMLHARKHRPPPSDNGVPAGMFLSLRNGMGALPVAIGRALTGDIRTGCAVRGLRREAGGYVLDLEGGEGIAADAVVLATPAAISAELVRPLDADLADRLAAIRHLSTATLSLVYARKGFPALDQGVGRGFIVPLPEQQTITACTFSSCKFAHRAGEDTVLLRAFVGGPRNGHRVHDSDGDLVAAVLLDLRKLAGITPDPLRIRIHRWPDGNPQYDVGHLDRVKAIRQRLKALPGLYLTGCAFGGVGVPDVIRQGTDTATEILHAGVQVE